MRMLSKAIDCVMIGLGWIVYWVLEIILYSLSRYLEWSDLRDQELNKSETPDPE